MWQNLALRETLESIGQSVTAKAAYHVQFFAHELPCSIDYPLCDPVPETLQGAEYLAEYLKRLCEENALLDAVDQAAARRMALAFCPDYAKLLVNLCEPTAVQLLGKSLLGHPLYPLELDAAQRHAVGRIACALPTGQLREELTAAARRAATQLNVPERPLLATAQSLAVRLPIAARNGNLENLFYSRAIEVK